MTDRPTWLTEACPLWCQREHAEADHPDDRYHQSDAAMAEALLGDGLGWSASHRSTLVVRAVRRVGQPISWICIDEAEGPLSLRITGESAHTLLEALARTVGALDQTLRPRPGGQGAGRATDP